MTYELEGRILYEIVEKQTLAFPKGILAVFLRVVELIEEFVPDIGRPHTAPLRKGLFEIRAKGRERESAGQFSAL